MTYRKRILFSKLGRAWSLDPKSVSSLGGDQDVQVLLLKLAKRHPDVEFVLIGKNSGESPQAVGYPANVTNPWEVWRSTFKNVPFSKIVAKTVADKPETMKRIADKVQEFVALAKPYLDTADDWIDCLGQHGAANTFIPQIVAELADGTKVAGSWDNPETWTNPQMSFVNYCSYLAGAMKYWTEQVCRHQDGPQFICFDPRNTIKIREISWPPRRPILAQYNQTYSSKVERYSDPTNPADYGFEGFTWDATCWAGKLDYKYGAVELCSMPAPELLEYNHEPPTTRFGIISNETRKQVKNFRSKFIVEWIIQQLPDSEIYGQWSKESLGWFQHEGLKTKVEPVPYSKMYSTLRTFKSTLTLPASGSGWATIKAWEAFANGVVCFFHEDYDDQGHIIPTLEQAQADPTHPLSELALFLRVRNRQEFLERVNLIDHDDERWRYITTLQRFVFEKAYFATHGGISHIELATDLATPVHYQM